MPQQAEPLKVQFCIPPLNTMVALAEDWQFAVFYEYRNKKMIEAAGLDKPIGYRWDHYGEELGTVTLPKGTRLAVDRIYVRRGKTEFDSITFRIKECPDPKFKKIRFWAKLRDVNRIICYPIGSEVPAINEAFTWGNDIRLLET